MYRQINTFDVLNLRVIRTNEVKYTILKEIQESLLHEYW